MITWIKRILLFLLIIFLAVLGLCAYRMHSATRAVPVLNYHQINDRDENSLTVHTDEFDEQMKYLSDNGYHTITPEEMMDAWENGTPLPEKPVILTFDDGYVDNYKNAYPILEKYNLKGTIFLISDFIGTYPNYMTWAQSMRCSRAASSISRATRSPIRNSTRSRLTRYGISSTAPRRRSNGVSASPSTSSPTRAARTTRNSSA